MRIARLSNLLIGGFFVFIIAYLWVSFYMQGFFINFFVAFLITVVVCWVVYFVSNKKKSKKAKTKAELEYIATVFLQFRFMPREKIVEYFGKLLRIKMPEVRFRKTYDRISADEFCLFPMFDCMPTVDSIIERINRTVPGKRTIIATDFVPPEVVVFFEKLDLDVVILSRDKLWEEIIFPSKYFPEIKIEQKKSMRTSLKALASQVFARRKVRGYIMVGVVIMLTSLIVRPTLFYVIMGTMVFSFALISLFRPVFSSGANIWKRAVTSLEPNKS